MTKHDPGDLFPPYTEVIYMRANANGIKREPVPAVYLGKNRGEGHMSNRHLIRIGNKTRWVAWYSVRSKAIG